MKKLCFAIAMVSLLCATTSRSQGHSAGEKVFKSKCAGCHGADAAGKPAVKSPSIKGKTADDILNEFSTSPKHASLKKLTPDQIKHIAAFLAPLK